LVSAAVRSPDTRAGCEITSNCFYLLSGHRFIEKYSTQLAAAAGLVPLPDPLYRKGYKLVKNWDFGQTIKTDDQLRAEFFTRYVYEGGKLDTFPSNKEWQRYRDNDNHRLEALRSNWWRTCGMAWWTAELRAACCAPLGGQVWLLRMSPQGACRTWIVARLLAEPT
jgi:hypothetical protein